MVNLEMLGRIRENKFHVMFARKGGVFEQVTRAANAVSGFDLAFANTDFGLRSDHQTFNQAGVPVLLLSGCGHRRVHEDAHKPSDTEDRINYDGLVAAARLVIGVIKGVSSMDGRPEQEGINPIRHRGEGSGLSFMGDMILEVKFDYPYEGRGARIARIIPGGNGDEAGLQEGDIIVEFRGKALGSMRDMFQTRSAMRHFRQYDPLGKMVVLRNGERVTIDATTMKTEEDD